MFKGLFGGKKATAAVNTPAGLPSGMSQSILQAIGSKGLPPMPGAAQKAFQLATDPKADARDFVEVIESDEGLSARVLKIANSVYFDRGKKSTTIEESVVVIGINELRSLLNATTLSEIFPSRNPLRPQLWSNDIATAIFSRTLAQRLLPSKSELAFLGGLMHDIGKLLLLQRCSEDYSKIMKKVESEGKDFCAAEQETYIFDHTEVGHLIAERWNFTPELTAMIRHHHDSWADLLKGGISLPAIVKAADCASHALGIGHPRGSFRLKGLAEAQLDEAWDALGIPAPDRKGMLTDLQRAHDLEQDLYSKSGGADD